MINFGEPKKSLGAGGEYAVETTGLTERQMNEIYKHEFVVKHGFFANPHTGRCAFYLDTCYVAMYGDDPQKTLDILLEEIDVPAFTLDDEIQMFLDSITICFDDFDF